MQKKDFYWATLGSCLVALFCFLVFTGRPAQAITKPSDSLTQLRQGAFEKVDQTTPKSTKSTTTTSTKDKTTKQTYGGNLGSSAWTFDDATGTLHFGAGSFANIDGSDRPWKQYQGQITSIIFDGNVTASNSCMSLFADLTNLTTIKNLNKFNTQPTTRMDSMFSGCSKLTSLDLSSFNTQNVTSMDQIFYRCSSLTTLDLTNFNTSKVTSMYGMFVADSSLTSLNVSSFDTSKVTNMQALFSNCSSLTKIDVSNFNTSNVTNMQTVFIGMSKLTTLDLSNFDTSKATQMDNMFSYDSSLTSLNLSSFTMNTGTSRGNMFTGATALNTLQLGPNTNINGTSLSEPINSYSGWLWQLTGSNTNPFYTSAGLMKKYDGTHPGTYVLVKAALNVHDSTIIQGSSWSPADNFDSFNDDSSWGDAVTIGVTTVITGPDGKTVSKLDTNVLGKYKVTYNYSDGTGTTRSSTASVYVLPTTSLTVPSGWDFGEIDYIGGTTTPLPVRALQKVNNNTDPTANKMKITTPVNGTNSGWTLNVKYANFTSPGQSDLTGTKLKMTNLELDDNTGAKVPDGTVNDGSLEISAGSDYTKLAGVSNPAITNNGTWTLQLGKQLSDVSLQIPRKPSIGYGKVVQYQSTISWQLVNSVG